MTYRRKIPGDVIMTPIPEDDIDHHNHHHHHHHHHHHMHQKQRRYSIEDSEFKEQMKETSGTSSVYTVSENVDATGAVLTKPVVMATRSGRVSLRLAPFGEKNNNNNNQQSSSFPTLTVDTSRSPPITPTSEKSRHWSVTSRSTLNSVNSVTSTFDSSQLFHYSSKKKKCQRRLSTLLHTHVILILVCTLSALDAVCVIGQLICDILIIKEKLDHFESIDVGLTEALIFHLPHLNISTHERWNLHAILAVLTGSDTHVPGNSLPFPSSLNDSTSSDPDSSSHRARRSLEPGVPGHEAVHGVLYDLTHVFHLGSMVILSCLLLETLLKLFAMGKKLRHHRLEVFDAVVVTISWSLDVAFWEGIWAQPGTEAATILIYLLPWRVVRIVNSFVLVIQEKDHVQLKIIKQRLRLSVKKSKEFTTKNSFLRHEVKALAGLCRKLGASEPEITACSPSGKAVKRSSVHSALERAASLTFISTMSSVGSVPSLFDMVESSSDEEDIRDLHGSGPIPGLKSTLSNSTQDSGSVAISLTDDTLNREVLDSPSCDSASSCGISNGSSGSGVLSEDSSTGSTSTSTPKRKRGLAGVKDKEAVSRTDSENSQPPSYHIATLDSDTRL